MSRVLFLVACSAFDCDARRARANHIESPSYENAALELNEMLDISSSSEHQYASVQPKHDGEVAQTFSQLLLALHPSTRAHSNRHYTPKTSLRASQPQQFFQSRAPEPPPPPEPESFIAEGVRGQLRVFGISVFWASLIAYVALLAPGKDEVAQALDRDLLAKLISNPFDPTVPPFFACVFNFMGLWPAWYAAVLLPGAAKQKPLPVAPFLAGSFAAGMFALSPYLALREYRADGVTQADLNALTRWTEGKLNAILLSLGALSLLVYGVTANDGNIAMSAGQYLELFRNQAFGHIMSLDFLGLWILSYGVLAEDAKRRGIECPSPLFAAVPILGHMSWLLLRPPLPEE